MHYFGEYNHIYFLMTGWTITGLCDRARRAETVEFVEAELIDLAEVPREVANLVIASPGEPYMIMPHGFGRTLRYKRVEHSQDGTLAAWLHVDLPEQALYRVSWRSLRHDGDTFELAPGVALTVSTALPWTYDGTTFQAITGAQPGEVAFLVEIHQQTPLVRDIVMVARAGHEREAIMVRAGCGTGFVPCFVVTDEQWADRAAMAELLTGLTVNVLIAVGLAAAPCTAELAATFVRDDGARPGKPGCVTLLAPDREDAYGPALALAVASKAQLVFADVDRLRLSDGTGDWALAEVLGTPLDLFDGPTDELVVCESSASQLLVCQAVGYAALWGSRIAFMPPVAGDNTFTTFTDAADLTRRACAAVPERLRSPDAETLTVFTRTLPLHLTPLRDGSQRWMDRYAVVHLPGQTASTLVPRLLGRADEPVPPVALGVVFDALGVLTATERPRYEEQLAGGLSAPLMLSAEQARRAVLQELVHKIDIDLLLIIAHGRDDHIDDGVNDQIPDSLIRTWRMRGQPVVINNSCGSWTSTGAAFLAAGARAVIGTLWPVANDLAVQVGTRIADQLHHQELASALKDAVTGNPDAAAYLFVGLPRIRVFSRPAVDETEIVTVLTGVLATLFECMHKLVEENKIDAAEALYRAALPALRERFRKLVTPGEVQLHLAPPLSDASVLDIDYVLATQSFRLLNVIRLMRPLDKRRGIAYELNSILDFAYRELASWDERNGTTESNNGMLHAIRYHLFTAGCVLPVVGVLAEVGEPTYTEKARWWLRTAALLVSRPEDVESGGDVPDDVLIRRIKGGLTISAQRVDVSGGPVEVDLLAGVLDRSVLIRQFAEAHDKLGDRESAARFRHAVEDPGPRTDVHGECAAAEQRLRVAARDGGVVPKHLVRQALSLTDSIEPLVSRVDHRCDILGALAAYYASRGDHHRARAVSDEIARHLDDPGARPSIQFNELAAWYYEHGDFDRALSCGIDNAEALAKAHHFDMSARTCTFVAQVSLRAYHRRPVHKHLRTFFEYSRRLGRIFKGHPAVYEVLSKPTADVWENTESIWRQLADQRRWRLALLGYAAQKAWPRGQVLPDYELLSHALHGRNVAAIKQLAIDGSLGRIGRVTIDGDFRVHTDVTTYREDLSEDGAVPRVVYGLLPLRGGEESDAVFVAGAAVYELTNDDEVTISQRGISLRDAVDDEGGFYIETWGSAKIRYDVSIELEPGLIPLVVTYTGKSTVNPQIQIRFSPLGCLIGLDQVGDRPWLGEVSMFVGRAPELYERTFLKFPYTMGLDLAVYNKLTSPFQR